MKLFNYSKLGPHLCSQFLRSGEFDDLMVAVGTEQPLAKNFYLLCCANIGNKTLKLPPCVNLLEACYFI